jgi:hypothetical protein
MSNKEDFIKPDTKEDKKKEFYKLVDFYLEGGNPMLSSKGKKEFEIRFGSNTNARSPLSKIDFDNVIKQLKTAGFRTDNEKGVHMLRVLLRHVTEDGTLIPSNVRAEIHGLDLVEQYCGHNSLLKLIESPENIMQDKIFFTQKLAPKMPDGKPIRPVDFPDMNFRADYKIEKILNIRQTDFNDETKWQNAEKAFRYIKRYQFYHPDYPFYVDMSIVKSSKKKEGTRNDYAQSYTVQESGVFGHIEKYEIEIEINNRKVGTSTPYNTTNAILQAIRKCSRIVLSGIQGSSYPISFTERDVVLQSYMRLLHGNRQQPRRVKSSDFIGPQSNTLQIENIIDDGVGESEIPNIRRNYSVTEKADGDRRMLFIDEEGKIYLFDMTMNVIFTGSQTKEKILFHTLIDGEHIKFDKYGKSINLFAAFDIYYVNGKSVRDKAFIPQKEDDLLQNFRLPILSNVLEKLKVKSILPENNTQWKEVKNDKGEMIWFDQRSGNFSTMRPIVNSSCVLRIQCKEFYASSSIFDDCSTILSKIEDKAFEYNTDGLIFTPTNMAVGGNVMLDNIKDKRDAQGSTANNSTVQGSTAGKLSKSVWKYSFKWKPVSHNTIDFLVNVMKDDTGKDKIHHSFQEGVNTQGSQNIIQYKTLVLMCGYNKKNGTMNPFHDMIHGKIPENEFDGEEDAYEAVPFIPTNPYDQNACLCNIALHDSGNGLYMTTEPEEAEKTSLDNFGSLISGGGGYNKEIEEEQGGEQGGEQEGKHGDVFEDMMIVEFRYDKKIVDPKWRWKPIRVRYDKTSELLRGIPNYGNAFHVADNNWRSIHNEVTPHMLKTGENIPEISIESDAYYNKTSGERFTEAMRNFHNLFVKQKLIKGVSNNNGTDMLIDYAVGKAGDLSKWIHSHLKFVFGIDLSHDNIHNIKDGACARYLKSSAKYKKHPAALFVQGNSGLNIRDTSAFPGDKDSKEKKITDAIFGKGPKDTMLLGKAVYERYAEAEQGFQISSCQFALHYFFENPKLLHGFLRNLAECTAMNGYFIGTCYDGRTVFNILSRKKKDDSYIFKKVIRGKEQRICEIKKMYEETGFRDDETSIGYPICVYQDSINNYIVEYLVNFNYLTQLLEDYGFTIITKDEANHMKPDHLPNGTGMFSELFEMMESEIKETNGKARAYYGKAANMSEEEKDISFMNRYFVFRKVRSVNAAKLEKHFLKKFNFDEDDENDELESREMRELKGQIEILEKEEKPVKKRIRKLKAKIVLEKEEKEGNPAIVFDIEEDDAVIEEAKPIEKIKKPRKPREKKLKEDEVKSDGEDKIEDKEKKPRKPRQKKEKTEKTEKADAL